MGKSSTKLQNATECDKLATAPVNWRLPKYVLDGLKEHSVARARTIAGQAAIALSDWLRTHTVTMAENPLNLAPANPTPPPGMKPASQVKTLPPSVQQIINSEDGWESSETVKK